jgi:hypothetical protein
LIYFVNRKIFSQTSKWVQVLKVFALFSVLVIMLIPVNLPNSIITPIIVLLTALHLLCDESNHKWKVLEWFRWVGDRSYSIYLVHMPLLYLAKFSPGLGNGFIQKLLVAIMIFASIFLGHMQFELIEKKFKIRGQGNILAPTKLLLKSAAVFVGIPIVLFGLILASAQMDFKPLVKNFEKDSKVDSHLLARAGCVDQEFNPSKCSWSVRSSKGSVLLVGDSQAYAAADGVRLAANGLDLNFLGVAASGCPFLKVDTTGTKPINCLNFQSSIIKYIKTEKPEIVIIANRTTGYLEPSAGWRTFLTSEGKPAKNEFEASKIYSENLFALSTQLNAIGTKVIIFQNIPEPLKISSPQSIFQFVFLRQHNKADVTSVVKLNEAARTIEKNLSQKGLISLYDPSKEICGISCTGEIKTENFFMDSWHLSTNGSLSLKKSLKILLEEHS